MWCNFLLQRDWPVSRKPFANGLLSIFNFVMFSFYKKKNTLIIFSPFYEFLNKFTRNFDEKIFFFIDFLRFWLFFHFMKLFFFSMDFEELFLKKSIFLDNFAVRSFWRFSREKKLEMTFEKESSFSGLFFTLNSYLICSNGDKLGFIERKRGGRLIIKIVHVGEIVASYDPYSRYVFVHGSEDHLVIRKNRKKREIRVNESITI